MYMMNITPPVAPPIVTINSRKLKSVAMASTGPLKMQSWPGAFGGDL